MKLYDCVVIGAGPGGLSAAVYVARYSRSCLVVDMGWGRSTTHEMNENYLGFPKGVHIEKLRELGKQQAEHFGAQFKQDKIIKIVKNEKSFHLEGGQQRYEGKTVILATGVTDLWPEFENFQDYLGKSLFWCITCDGHKTIGKRVVLFGDDDDCACTAMQFLNFTSKISLVTNQHHRQHKLHHVWKERLAKAGIPMYEGCLKKVHGRGGYVNALELDTGQKIETDFIFSEQGATPNSELAKELGIATNEHGYIKVDHNQRTNIPGVFACGDLTRRHSHQVVIAAAEGATAGEAANYDLYRPEQKWV